MVAATPYLIDWLTLRLPISTTSHPAIFERVLGYLGNVFCTDKDGAIKWATRRLDIDALRSDSPGLYWQVTGDGVSDALLIGASPATLEHGLNVWGSLDIVHCARVLIAEASKRLQILLPGPDQWACTRIDVTANYALPDATSVKSALAQLLVTSGSRRRASSHNRGGDTVYWSQKSDLVKGKAYHKGPQVLALWKRNKIDTLPPEHDLLDQIIRLEHTRGHKWFRELRDAGARWQDLTYDELIKLHTDFFSPLIEQGIEVTNMDRDQILKAIIEANACSESQARAVFNTYKNCRTEGFEVTRDMMAPRTFRHHTRLLTNAGISDFHLRTAKLIPFPKVQIVLAKAVANWDDIRRAAAA